MKKKIAVYSLLVLGLLLSCSKDSGNDDDPNSKVDKSANLLGTGASAQDLLANTKFDEILIEIAYVSGFRPTAEAIATFEEFIRARTFKEEITFTYKQLPSPNEETLTKEEVADLEKENRTAYNDGSTLALYIYFADAPSDSDDESENLVTLGVVYRNTSMVIYEATIRDLVGNSAFVSVADVESATLNHEFGHLLGLVNLGTPVVNNHEDPEADSHCTTEGCLMRAELQFGGPMVKQMQRNASKGLGTIPNLDAECLLDLQSNGGR
ncbi:hypothetical protein J0X14_05720 [Muricauda sp. CAU 1633]|uniref:hypothetical protein n=1 Tax=Allomuricauda sp. CAU 1633 TaxID=2816036 RepID=UPI001A8EF5B8|nr:hypothetical protein [Muricauda sp. CAU 1633]MBO0321786.1 hypothetical protein [Muricauda sp. CAU 1633]